jgi:hypothetical protein
MALLMIVAHHLRPILVGGYEGPLRAPHVHVLLNKCNTIEHMTLG